MTKEMAQFRDIMTTRFTEQGRRIDFWYKASTKLLGGQIDLLPSSTRDLANEVLRNPDYLYPSGTHPAFRTTFAEATRPSCLQMVMATVPGYTSWQTCAVISTWASTRARRQSGQVTSESAAAKAKAKANPKQTVGNIGAVAPCTIPVPSTRVGMVRLMILSRGNKDSNIVFSAGRFATMLTVPTQSIFCQLIPSTSDWTKGGNFSAMASDKLAELLLKCFHAPTPKLHSDCIYLPIFLCCI